MTDFPDVHLVDDREVRDLTPEAIGPDGRLRVLPAEFWAATTREERGVFGNRHGLYSFPTVELVDYLRQFIRGRRAIEIGAGHGVLAEALGIPATDNKHQLLPDHRKFYGLIGQTLVPYGPNVEKLDARRAVSKYRPEVVIGCWVTHRYDPKRHELGGNTVGVDEARVLRWVEDYVHVGNEKVHEHKPLLAVDHATIYAPFVFSRALNGAADVIQIWSGQG